MTPCHAHELADSRRLLLPEDVDLIREGVRLLASVADLFVLDLGAGSGTSALSVFSERPERVTVLTVDHNAVAIDSTRELLTNYGYVDKWIGVLADTCDLTKIADIVSSHPRLQTLGPIDMLMIDSSHEYAATVGELETWLPSMRSGGIVWCHDYNEPRAYELGLDTYPGVGQAIYEAEIERRLQRIKVAGLGWLGMAVR